MWIPYAIICALGSAFCVVIVKKLLKNDIPPFTITWGILLTTTPFVLLKTFSEPLPEINNTFYLAVAGSVFFFLLNKPFMYGSWKMADLSKVFPITALSPILVLIFAWFPPLNEHPPLLSIIGALVALLGAYVLSIPEISKGIFRPFTILFKEKFSRFALITVVMVAIVVIFDKLAIQSTTPSSSTFVLLSENIIAIIAIIPILLKFEPNFLHDLWKSKGLILLLGTIAALSGITGMAAIGMGNVGIVTVVMKLELFFVLLFSLVLFKDKPKLHTVLGSLIMILGIAIIGMMNT